MAKVQSVHQLIEIGFHEKASDIMIKGNARPMMKQFSKVVPIPGEWDMLTPDEARDLVGALMNEKQERRFEDEMEMDLGFAVKDLCRVRCNIYMQRGTYAIVARIVPLEIKQLEELGLPPVLSELTKHKQGLVLVTGPTGSGKTTTLAALLDLINQSRPCHIVTIEDPLEFTHRDKTAYVSQRELHLDTADFGKALRAVVREAPDVILIGEMRDPETMHAALQAGETGHLVFSTVHTSSAYETMDRVINMFPPHEKVHLCQRMSNSLRAIVAQKLVPKSDGFGRVVANEILICTPTVTKCIEDGAFSDLYHHMNEGSFWGMQTMNQSLLKHVKAGNITEEMALQYAGVTSELKQMLRR